VLGFREGLEGISRPNLYIYTIYTICATTTVQCLRNCAHRSANSSRDTATARRTMILLLTTSPVSLHQFPYTLPSAMALVMVTKALSVLGMGLGKLGEGSQGHQRRQRCCHRHRISRPVWLWRKRPSASVRGVKVGRHHLTGAFSARFHEFGLPTSGAEQRNGGGWTLNIEYDALLSEGSGGVGGLVNDVGALQRKERVCRERISIEWFGGSDMSEHRLNHSFFLCTVNVATRKAFLQATVGFGPVARNSNCQCHLFFVLCTTSLFSTYLARHTLLHELP
jgi:hypothetical protein